MLTVYGDNRSGNCLKVKWLLDLSQIDYQWIETDVTSGVTRSAGFLALNPAGQTPTVVLDDGRPLAQSNALLLYFGEGGQFIPGDPYDRARMMEWLFWEQFSHEPYIAVVRFQRAIAGWRADRIEPRLIERGYVALGRMEQALAGRNWLVGETPTLADLSLVAYTRVAPEGDFDLTAYPNVVAWVARAEAAFGIS